MPKATKQRAERTESSKGTFIRIAGKFDRIFIEMSRSRHWFELIAILVAFVAGAASILTFAPHLGTSVYQTWKVVLISAATLCVGFGAAALFYGRLREQETHALRTDFRNLRSRADALVAKFDDFERSKREP